eukprot:g531.t1
MKCGLRILLGFVLCLSVWNEVASFKEHDFKKCQDASFCVRNRQETENRYYRLIPDSLSSTESTITAKLVNEKLDETFTLSLYSIAGAVRVQVSELDQSVSRYQLQSVLVHDPPLTGPSWVLKKDGTGIKLMLTNSVVTLTYNPFTLVVVYKGKPLLKTNGNNLFHMEHWKQASSEDDSTEDRSETFKNFRDSRPRGAMAMSLDLTFLGMTHVFGIPEHASDVSLPDTIKDKEPISEPFRLYNLDVFEYGLNSPFGLYGSIPFLLSQSTDSAAGVFWMNAAEMYVDLWKDKSSTHSQWLAESGAFDVFLIVGDHSRDIIRHYTSLTGTTAMPQYFAIGYHQCRWNYRNEQDVRKVDNTFDELDIPYDVLWLDIEHTDGKKYMTWDHNAFPNPETMQNDLASRGRKMVTIVDPHIKRDDQYQIHLEATKRGYYVKNVAGQDFTGHCWPGSSSYLDVIRPEVRSWWAERFQMGNYPGMTKSLYIWNDMNEPSVFDGPEITMQKDLLHNGTIEHREVHNVYGFYYHMATNKGLMLRGLQNFGSDGDRPFVLSRAYFAGSQRLGPIWTGDNGAKWEDLKASIPMLLTNNLAGMAYCGADVGGFFGDPDAELFTRWYQLAIFYPFFRGHAHIDTKRREPWVYGEPTTSRVKKALKERYALLPYLYTMFRLNNLTGEPIMRPLWYEFTNQNLFSSQEQFMLGPALMIRPILESGTQSVSTMFPQGVIWYNAWTGEKVTLNRKQTEVEVTVDQEKIPFYYKGGSIVPRKERPRRCTEAMALDPITLIVALNERGEARGEIYIDDGRSFAFLRGQSLHREFKFSNNKLTSTEVSSGSRKSHYKAKIEVERIVIMGLPSHYQVYEEGTKRRIDSFFGRLRLENVGGPANVGFVVKKPSLSVDDNWTLVFTKAKQ